MSKIAMGFIGFLSGLTLWTAAIAGEHIVSEEDNDQNQVICKVLDRVELLEKKVTSLTHTVKMLQERVSKKADKK